VRIGMLTFRSFAATDEGHPEEAESLAREAKALVDRFRLQGIPQAIWRPSRWDVRSQDTGSWRRPRRNWRALTLRDKVCPA
jgi:hypothetical protein